MPLISISRATAADLDELAPLFDGYRVFYKQSSSIDAARAFLRDRFDRSQSVIYIARADLEGAERSSAQPLHAAGMAQLYPTFSSVSLSSRWILNDLFVDPRFRGRGIGKALTLRCMDHCRETGAGAMMLLTELTNQSAQQLYESLGWVRDTTYYRYTWKP